MLIIQHKIQLYISLEIANKIAKNLLYRGKWWGTGDVIICHRTLLQFLNRKIQSICSWYRSTLRAHSHWSGYADIEQREAHQRCSTAIHVPKVQIFCSRLRTKEATTIHVWSQHSSSINIAQTLPQHPTPGFHELSSSRGRTNLTGFITSSWNHTSCAHRRGLSWRYRGWQSWGTHPGLSPAACIPCSSRRLRCRRHRRWRSAPGRTHSCTRHRHGPVCTVAHMSRRWRIYRHTSHTAARWRCQAASGTWSGQGGASPWLSDVNLASHSTMVSAVPWSNVTACEEQHEQAQKQ